MKTYNLDELTPCCDIRIGFVWELKGLLIPRVKERLALVSRATVREECLIVLKDYQIKCED